jgi:acetate kinase
MGTRCGSLDPGVILFLLRRGMTVDDVETLLYQKSGLLGLSGVSNDVRQLLASDRPAAGDALEFFVWRIVREIGSLAAALGGLDGLVFTAGVGENSPVIRARVCQEFRWLGIQVNADANQRGPGRISPAGRTPAVWVIPTDEEGVIAEATARLAAAAPPHALPAPRHGTKVQ